MATFHLQEQEFMLKLLSSLHKPNDLKCLTQKLTALMQNWSGCEAVGIRLKDGEDYPYTKHGDFPRHL